MRMALTALASSLVLAACGSSGNPGASASGADPALQFAQCMRAHGVSNFPDPSAGGGLQITPGSGLNPQSPVFQSAQNSCKKFLPNKGGPPHMTASERRAALRFAECMRVNGVPNFPDPMDRAPSGASRVLVLRGMVFTPGPNVDPMSPAFRQAMTRCGVRPPRGSGPRSIG